ncbi:Uncharacterized protein OBRU01_03753 [Operophtera brumata]|uniref:Uncharacterized protein n=1 Tax=Operophtera brumata TaxID=104452 RepID=A0A0L7LQ53_OPEBR|nr:Uncharacterized protein OBRU01_03753 [Operophtera brumata]
MPGEASIFNANAKYNINAPYSRISKGLHSSSKRTLTANFTPQLKLFDIAPQRTSNTLRRDSMRQNILEEVMKKTESMMDGSENPMYEDPRDVIDKPAKPPRKRTIQAIAVSSPRLSKEHKSLLREQKRKLTKKYESLINTLMDRCEENIVAYVEECKTVIREERERNKELEGKRRDLEERDSLISDYEKQFEMINKKSKQIVAENKSLSERVSAMDEELVRVRQSYKKTSVEKETADIEKATLTERAERAETKLKEVYELYEDKMSAMMRDYETVHREYFTVKNALEASEGKMAQLDILRARTVPADLHEGRLDHCKRLLEELKHQYGMEAERKTEQLTKLQEQMKITEDKHDKVVKSRAYSSLEELERRIVEQERRAAHAHAAHRRELERAQLALEHKESIIRSLIDKVADVEEVRLSQTNTHRLQGILDTSPEPSQSEPEARTSKPVLGEVGYEPRNVKLIPGDGGYFQDKEGKRKGKG